MKMQNNYEFNLKTKAWGITFSGPDLVLTSIHNRFNQFEYKDMEVLPDYDKLEDQEVQDFIDDFLTRSKVKRGDAFLGISRSEYHSFTVEFPLEAEESLSDTIGYQIENLYPGDPEEIDVFHQIIGREEQLKVQVICVPKTYIGKIFGLIRRWKLKLAGITVESMALINGLSKIYLTDFKKKQIALFHSLPDGLEMIGLKSGVWTGSYFARFDELPEEEDLAGILEEGFGQIRLDPYQVDDFVFSGSKEDRVKQQLSGLGIEFAALNDARGGSIPESSLSGLGCAITALHEKLPLTLNILPLKLQGRHHQLPVLIAMLVVLALVGWFITVETRSYLALQKELTRYQKRNAKLEEQLVELTQARNAYQERKDLVESYRKYIYSNNLVLKVMSIISAEMPDHTFLSNFSLRDGVKLTMQIETDDFFEVRNKLEKLPYFKNVDTANAISQARTGNKRKTNLKMDIVLEAFNE
jgi:hypothetical protein